jgi:hypothetical protein
MSAKIIAVDELATSRMLAACSHGVRCPHGVGPFPAFSTGLLAKWLA